MKSYKCVKSDQIRIFFNFVLKLILNERNLIKYFLSSIL